MSALGALLLAASSAAQSAGTPDPAAQRIDDYLARCVPFGFSGSVLVAKDGAVVLSKGYGVADRESGAACAPETIFDVGSLTKQFTAALVLVLEQEKVLETGETLGDFLDDVPREKQKIRIEHLLSHTSGLPRWVEGSGSPLTDRDELIRLVLDAPLHAAPGEHFVYSNIGYQLLAALLEIRTQQPFERLLEERLFLPAGMKSTGFRQDGELAASLAARAFLKPDAPLPVNSVLEDDGERERGDERELATEGWYSWGLRGAGGVLSTVEDFWRWEQALAGGKLLDEASTKKLFTPVRGRYALGWYVHETRRRTRWIEHGGSTASGFESKCSRFPDEAAFVVLLGNSCDEVHGIPDQVNELLFGGTRTLPPARFELPGTALDALAGEYAHRGRARFRISRWDDGLLLEARTSEAFELFAGEPSGEQRKLLVPSGTVVAGLRRADFGALRTLARDPDRFGYMEDWWQHLSAHHGKLRRAEVLGATSPHGSNETVALLEFERGEELLRLLFDSRGKLGGLNIGPPYVNRIRLVPVSATSFAWFDLGRALTTAELRVREKKDASELELTLEGGSFVLARP